MPTERSATYVLQLDQWLCPSTVFISLAIKGEKNRHVRFVLNRSAKLQLECINQLWDCQPRTWVVFHGGLGRTRSVSRHVTGLESYRRSFPPVVNPCHNKTVAIVGEGQKDKETAKSFFATRQRRAIE